LTGIKKILKYHTESALKGTKKGDYDRAIADYTEAIRINQYYADGYSGRADAYIKKRDWDRAIADCTQAISYAKGYSLSYEYWQRAFVYMQKGNYTQARADVNKALQSPNNENAKNLDAELKKLGY